MTATQSSPFNNASQKMLVDSSSNLNAVSGCIHPLEQAWTTNSCTVKICRPAQGATKEQHAQVLLSGSAAATASVICDV